LGLKGYVVVVVVAVYELPQPADRGPVILVLDVNVQVSNKIV